MAHPEILSPEMLKSFHAENRLEAISAFRQDTQAGLKDAGDWFAANLQGEQLPLACPAGGEISFACADVPVGFPPDVLDAMQHGEKIKAIRLFRDAYDLDLRIAKARVESWEGWPSGSEPKRPSGYLGLIIILLVAGAVIGWPYLPHP